MGPMPCRRGLVVTVTLACVGITGGWLTSREDLPSISLPQASDGAGRYRRGDLVELDAYGPAVRCGGGIEGPSTLILPSEHLEETDLVHDGDRRRAEWSARHRRATPTSENRSCDVSLDLDASFVDTWGGAGTLEERQDRAKIRAVELILQASELLDLPQNREAATRARVISAHASGSRFTGHVNLASGSAKAVSLMSDYRQELGDDATVNTASRTFRAEWQPLSTSVCLNILFTSLDLDGVMGAAMQGEPEPSRLGGACDQRIRSGIASNVAIVNTMAANTSGASPWQMLMSTAHELVHALGSIHDCELTSSSALANGVETCPANPEQAIPCVPDTAAGGAYLMFPTIADLSGDSLNNRLLSPCSESRMATVLDVKGDCLSTAACTEPGPCCAGEVPFPDGAACAGVTGTCNAGQCEVCADEDDCVTAAPATALPSCAYERVTSSTTVCSEACGASERTVLMVCRCGNASATPEACGGVPQYSASVPCRVADCDQTAPHFVTLQLGAGPTTLDGNRLEFYVLSALGIHVQIHRRVQAGGGNIAVQLKSCRYFGESSDCVPATVLAGWLADPTNRSTLEAAAGHSVTVLDSSAAVNGSDGPFLTTAQTWWAVLGIDAIAIFFGLVNNALERQRRKKVEKRRAAARQQRSQARLLRAQSAASLKTLTEKAEDDREGAEIAMVYPVELSADSANPEWDHSWDDGSGGHTPNSPAVVTLPSADPAEGIPLPLDGSSTVSEIPRLSPTTKPIAMTYVRDEASSRLSMRSTTSTRTVSEV